MKGKELTILANNANRTIYFIALTRVYANVTLIARLKTLRNALRGFEYNEVFG